MDEHNVHQFWGASPGIDLLGVQGACTAAGSINLLQVGSYDVRHTLYTVCQLHRHVEIGASEPDVEVMVYEDCLAVLARHMILLAIFLDTSVPLQTRTQRFLEVFGNVMIRQDTFDYLQRKCQELESLVQLKMAGDPGKGTISDLFDISMLSYQQRDELLAALVTARQPDGFDMAKAWDGRCRLWYADRYDFRKNMIDWDYHMRLAPAGNPGQDEAGSVIHFYHFRHWRQTGVAFEVRNCAYNAPNLTLLSSATGRTKEFKDRPYHSFGTLCEDTTYYKRANKEFKYTALDISERNVLNLAEELSTGQTPPSSTTHEAHRAYAARGPTDLKDLEAQQDHSSNQAGACQLKTIDECDEDEMRPHDAATASAGQDPEITADTHNKASALSAAAVRTLARVKIRLVSGDFAKSVAGKRKLAGKFSVATVGSHHAHVLKAEHQLAKLLRPGARVLAESAEYFVQLKPENVGKFEEGVTAWAQDGGFVRAVEHTGAPGHMVFKRPEPAFASG